LSVSEEYQTCLCYLFENGIYYVFTFYPRSYQRYAKYLREPHFTEMSYEKYCRHDISGATTVNPLVAFYDIQGRKREILFFNSVPDTTGETKHYTCISLRGQIFPKIINDVHSLLNSTRKISNVTGGKSITAILCPFSDVK
jgi:hypothetical protein